ncbi:MAG: hypothetical protein ABI083_19165, partial [Lapillicoccus sp.]
MNRRALSGLLVVVIATLSAGTLAASPTAAAPPTARPGNPAAAAGTTHGPACVGSHKTSITCPVASLPPLSTQPQNPHQTEQSSEPQADPTAQQPFGYTPADLRSAYALPSPSSTAGDHQTVAVVAIGANPYEESDLAVYRARFGLPPCTTASGCLRIVDTKNLPDTDEGHQIGAVAALEMISAT